MTRVPRLTIAAIGILIFSLTHIAVVGAESSDESSFVAKINSERAARGLGTLTWREQLAQVGRRHSTRMADQNNLHHNPNLRNEVQGWEVVGENVGYGPSVEELHTAFMNSASHRANIMDGDYTHIGVGTVWRDGTLWVTEVFMRPSASGSSSTSSVSRPTTRRRSAPRRKPASVPAAAPVSVPPAPRKPAPAPAPAPTASSSAADLTRLMVANLLTADEPAVATLGFGAVSFPEAASGDGVVAWSFKAFGAMAARVNRQLLAGRAGS